MKKILVTGSIAYDVLLGYDGSFADALKNADMEKLSVSFFSPHFTRHHGGTGANIAWNLRLLGQDPLLVGTVGNDGGEYTTLMKDRGIDVTRVQVLKDHVTATAIIGTDSNERQIAFFHPGADTHGSWPDLSDDREDIAVALVGARDASLMLGAVTWLRASKVPFIFDPGQQVLALGGDELKSSALASAGVITNEFEWEMLSEKTGCAVSDLLVSTPFVIVTRGEQGLSLYTKEGEQNIVACKADKVVNPTGAGDALRAGLLTGMAHQWSLVDSARLGAALASFVVEQEGTLLESLDIDELQERARQAYGKTLPKVL
ncbi:MAG TPA: carbohydrate kinase family protein [Candidatus Peribacteraceae bacterium]|nr:carbohydrate kinase family protein [Candidatus Peribacteraceae bacterium]